MKKVDIAMATYNGEQFIEAQIKSIQAQTYENWELYISDDESKDNTINLIKKMMQNDSRIKLINTKRQGGVIPNFNKALEYTSADYITLCDQDDIWPEERLYILVNKIQELEGDSSSTPLMVFTDLQLVDENGNKIADSFYQSNNLNPNTNLEKNNLIWRSTVYGCTVILNKALLSLSFPVPEYAQMHDQWLALNASRKNGLYFFDYKSVRYRQHGGNVVGGRRNSVLSKIKNIKRNFKNIRNNVYKIKATLENHPELYNGIRLRGFKSVNFSFKEVFPYIFKSNKKIQTFIIFIGLVLFL